jgi:hypothetical protein
MWVFAEFLSGDTGFKATIYSRYMASFNLAMSVFDRFGLGCRTKAGTATRALSDAWFNVGRPGRRTGILFTFAPSSYPTPVETIISSLVHFGTAARAFHPF